MTEVSLSSHFNLPSSSASNTQHHATHTLDDSLRPRRVQRSPSRTRAKRCRRNGFAPACSVPQCCWRSQTSRHAVASARIRVRKRRASHPHLVADPAARTVALLRSKYAVCVCRRRPHARRARHCNDMSVSSRCRASSLSIIAHSDSDKTASVGLTSRVMFVAFGTLFYQLALCLRQAQTTLLHTSTPMSSSSSSERADSSDSGAARVALPVPQLRPRVTENNCSTSAEQLTEPRAMASEHPNGQNVEEPLREDRAATKPLFGTTHSDDAASVSTAHTSATLVHAHAPPRLVPSTHHADHNTAIATPPSSAAHTAAPIDDQAATNARVREMELFEQQLEKEMQKRRPDHFIIGVICRSLGGVPTRMRASVWQELLGVTRTERVLLLDQSILAVEEDLENQKVISADASRTRGHDAFFRQPATVALVTKLLTYYCKCRSVRYKQGMNEVLAPFLLLEDKLPDGVVFQCFYALIDKFLPHVFSDREFQSLQCSFQLYRLLLLYHDPMLCHYLDQHDMTPELYVTPWFMTLFARGLAPTLVFQLWDFFLLEPHPFLLHYVAYALVAAHKPSILSADVASLPQVLASITFRSREELEAVCDHALQLARVTPRSFERDLYAVCYGGYTMDTSAPFVRHISAASSLQVYPDELVANLLQRISAKAQTRAAEAASASVDSDADSRLDPLLSPLARTSSFSTERSASASSVFFIVLDCRPIAQYRACHLSLSYHIDPDVVGSPDALVVLLQGFARMKGCHFCFVGPSDPMASNATTAAAKASTIALDTISRLARGISGERKLAVDPIDTGVSSSAASSRLPMSPGVPGAGANDIIGCEPSSRRVHYEHISVTRLVLMFLQKGFEHISRLDGGFDELKRTILSMDAFTQDQLLVSAEPRASTPSSSGSGFKLFSKIGLTRLRSATSDDNIVASAGSSSSSSSDAPSEPLATSSAQLSTATAAPDATTTIPRLRSKPSTLSQRFQSFTTAVSQGATSVVRARSASGHATSVADPELGGTHEQQLVGEDEWVEVCLRTKEALAKSLAYKDVVFQAGPMGILLQKATTSKKFQAVVDSIVPESQASESQQLQRGDLLVAVNGQSMESVPFVSVVALVKDAKRPVVLRFQNANAKQALESFDALSIPPLAPTLVSASQHAIGISWRKLALPDVRYHVQYARQSEFHFSPWLSVTMKQATNDSAARSASGITRDTNGTLVGLEPGESVVFRVRCGNGVKWGPYSLSSAPISTLERSSGDGSSSEHPGVDSVASDVDDPTSAAVAAADDVRGRKRERASSRSNIVEPVFLPGSCPVVVEHGRFYYRVVISLRARRRPAVDADKLARVLDKGDVIVCSTRVIAPGTNQIFVRLMDDDVGDDVSAVDVSSGVATTGSSDLLTVGPSTGSDSVSDDMDDIDDADGVWAFENTPEGTVVLERISEPPVDDVATTPVAASIPLQEHAKSVVAAIFSGTSSMSSGSAKTSTTTTAAAPASADDDMDVFTSLAARILAPPLPPVVAPTILQVFAVSSTSIVVTWDPINDVGVTKYQIQYAKNRLAAMWWSVHDDIAADSLKFTVTDLLPSTAYVFRIRGYNDASGWTPYSDASESCRTPNSDDDDDDTVASTNIVASTKSRSGSSDTMATLAETDDTTSVSSAPTSRTASGNSFRLPVNSIFSTTATVSTAQTSSSTASTVSSGPLRTGSTFLDKAVAAASRLTRRRSLSSSASTAAPVASTAAAALLPTDSLDSMASSSGADDATDSCDLSIDNNDGTNNVQDDQMLIDEAGGVTLVHLGHWKQDTGGAFEDFRFFAATQYTRRTDASSATAAASATASNATSPVSTASSFDAIGERDLVVTPTSLFVLNASATTRDGFAVLEHSRMLESLVKITAHRAVPNLIVLHFQTERFTEPAASRRALTTPTDSSSNNATVAAERPDPQAQPDATSAPSSEPQATSTEQLYFAVCDPDACVALVRQYFEQLVC